MKNLGFILVLILSIISCKKTNSEGNKSIIQEQETIITKRYVAIDRSSALVDFIEINGEKKIKVRNNKKTIELPFQEENKLGHFYTKDGIELRVFGDSITISQDNNIIELVKAGN